MTETLLPCPFCNNEAHLLDEGRYYYAVCEFCNCKTSYERSEDIVRSIWNTRPTGWISVKTQLPPKLKWVLTVTEPNDSAHICWFNGSYFERSDTGYIEKPTHWCWLPDVEWGLGRNWKPEPPEKEDKE